MDTTKVLSGITTENLNKIIKHESLIVKEEKPKKGDLVSVLEEHCDDIGINLVMENLTKQELDSACKHIKLDLSEDGKNPSKAVIKKRLARKAGELGVTKFFEKFGDSAELITVFADTVGVESDAKDAKKSAKEVGKEVASVGLDSLLNRLDLSFLKTIAEAMDLSTNSVNKTRIVKAIMTGKNVKATPSSDIKKRLAKEQEEAEKSAEKENKPTIKKGITYQDMFQQYLRSELADWCKENGLKVSGKKPDLIKRILAYFDGDKETTMAAPKKEKKDAPKSPKKDKKTTKKAETEKEKEEKAASSDEEKDSSKKSKKGTK